MKIERVSRQHGTTGIYKKMNKNPYDWEKNKIFGIGCKWEKERRVLLSWAIKISFKPCVDPKLCL